VFVFIARQHAMHAERDDTVLANPSVYVCLSIRLSVRPSHSGILNAPFRP